MPQCSAICAEVADVSVNRIQQGSAAIMMLPGRACSANTSHQLWTQHKETRTATISVKAYALGRMTCVEHTPPQSRALAASTFLCTPWPSQRHW